MGSLGPVELAILAMLGLLLFGPERLISIARSLGKSIAEFRRTASEIQEQLTQVAETTEPLLTEQSTTVETWEAWPYPESTSTPAPAPRQWRGTPWRRAAMDGWTPARTGDPLTLRVHPGITRVTRAALSRPRRHGLFGRFSG